MQASVSSSARWSYVLPTPALLPHTQNCRKTQKRVCPGHGESRNPLLLTQLTSVSAENRHREMTGWVTESLWDGRKP